MKTSRAKTWVVIPTFNRAEDLARCMDAVLGQSVEDLGLVVVDNGSRDNTRQIIEDFEQRDPRVRSIFLDKNYGFTGGINPGFALALREGATYVAGCNNDAQPHRDWLKHLVAFLDQNTNYGIAACKMLSADGKTIDSTGEEYSVWGLAFPRGRGEPAGKQYDDQTELFAASGGGSLYRASMLQRIGLFDDDFFAYNEDVDLSFRAQLQGWQVSFVPSAVLYHAVGKTADALGSGFRTYQTMKNLPFVVWKNMPARYLWRVLPRLMLAQMLFLLRAIQRGQGWAGVKGLLVTLVLLPKKVGQRWTIQRQRKIQPAVIWAKLYHDLPPEAARLRSFRNHCRKLLGRRHK